MVERLFQHAFKVVMHIKAAFTLKQQFKSQKSILYYYIALFGELYLFFAQVSYQRRSEPEKVM